MDMNRYGNNPPIKEGDIIEITIEGTGAKGDGIGKIDNFVVMVPGAREGDTVKVRITRVLRRMAFGELAEEGAESTTSEEEEPMADEDEDVPMDDDEELDDEDDEE